MSSIRNIAIIAHVDHGKTTLVDKILHQCQLFRKNQEVGELILDNNDLERERGITIVAKNVSVTYKDVKINVIDTPGHADFGGEVERVLNMADGVLLLVDAFEGPMPQTRYVLGKALALNLKPIVVINKVDKPNCRPEDVQNQVFDLMVNLGATDDQIDFPTVFGSAKNGWMSSDYKTPATDITFLLDTILNTIKEPKKIDGTVQLQITSLDYSNFQGKIAIGRVKRGTLRSNIDISLVKRDGSIVKARIKELFTFDGLGRRKVEEVVCGDLAAIVGLDSFDIGDTIADAENPEGLPTIPIDEPTMSMLFTVNNSPLFGKEGKFITSRHIKERLEKELEKNLALRVEPMDSPDQHLVFGRGIMHLAILVETMRREGYELQLGQPKVIIKMIDGVKHEPVELLTVDVPEESASKIIDAVLQRKGEMVLMEPKGDLTHIEFNIPSRGLIGLRTIAMNLSSGEAIMAHIFKGFEPWKGNVPTRTNGTLVSMEAGKAIPYAMDKLQDRGKFFIEPGVDVYAGQIVGENIRNEELIINVTKKKALTNMRASGSDDKVKLPPATIFSLEESMEYIDEDEYVEVTPKSIRLRKIILDENERKRTAKNRKSG